MSDLAKFTEYYEEYRNTLVHGVPPEETLLIEECKDKNYLEHLFQTLSADESFVEPKLVAVFKPDETFTSNIFAKYVASTNKQK